MRGRKELFFCGYDEQFVCKLFMSDVWLRLLVCGVDQTKPGVPSIYVVLELFLDLVLVHIGPFFSFLPSLG